MSISLIVFIKHRPDMTADAFSHYWREVHAPLLLACTDFSRHILRYEQFHGSEQTTTLGAMFGASGDFDGIAAITFADAHTLKAAFGTALPFGCPAR